MTQAKPANASSVSSQRKPPLAFVDEYGQANLDLSVPDVGTHFVLTAILVEEDAAATVRASPKGYKVPVAIADVGEFVALADTVVHPMLHRVARARDAVLLVTQGRVDVLGGDRLSLLSAAVDSIRSAKPG